MVSKVKANGCNAIDAIFNSNAGMTSTLSTFCSDFFFLAPIHAFKLSEVPTEGACPPGLGLNHFDGHK